MDAEVTSLTDEDVELGLRAEGFLAPAIDRYRAFVVAEHRAWFHLARRLNRLATASWLQHPITEAGQEASSPEPTAIRLMARVLNAFQAAILLLERGMTVEAGAMTRAVYEAAFWIAYLKATPEAALENFMLDEEFSRRGTLKAHEKVSGNKPARLAEIARQLVELDKSLAGKPRPLSMAKVAEYGGVSHYYAFYKTLCGASAHASASSTDHYLEVFDDGTAGHTIGPDLDGIPIKMTLACHAMVLATGSFLQMTNSVFWAKGLVALNGELIALAEESQKPV